MYFFEKKRFSRQIKYFVALKSEFTFVRNINNCHNKPMKFAW